MGRPRTNPLSRAERFKKYYDDPVWRKNLLERRKTSRSFQDNRLRSVYGITLDQYEKMLKDQGGVCFLCHQLPYNSRHKKLHVDHDHETGRVRGLLCFVCNRGLGSYEHFVKVCGHDAIQRYIDGWPVVEEDKSVCPGITNPGN